MYKNVAMKTFKSENLSIFECFLHLKIFSKNYI